MDIAVIIKGLELETWKLFLEMAPYLLFGFFVAGILHVFIPSEKIFRHLSRNSMASVMKASLFGVPLPLCSCGVIPVAAHLKKQGAGNAPTLAFLVSTPTTGIDSILATYALLGPVFAVIRPVAAFFAGILAGGIVQLYDRDEKKQMPGEFTCVMCDDTGEHTHGIIAKAKAIFRYAFIDLLQDVGKWLVIGITAGGAISFFFPQSLIENYLGNPWLAYPLMLLIGIPFYVCATGSIPIAASLIAKGMLPGAGLVFLIAGPAASTATLSFVGGKMGRKNLAAYLASIVVTAVLFGLAMDYFYPVFQQKAMHHHGGGLLSLPVKTASAAVFGIFMVIAFVLDIIKRNKKVTADGVLFRVPDMTCSSCEKTITAELKKLPEVREVNISLKNKIVQIKGGAGEEEVFSAVRKAGYSPERMDNGKKEGEI